MRHHRITSAAVAVAGIAASLIFSAQPSQAGLVTSCTGAASDVTIPGDLFVPAGESCELTNVIVNGNTTVRADANLILTDGTLNGTLTLQSNGFASTDHVTVTGATRLNTAFGVLSTDSTLRGNVNATDAGLFIAIDSALGASLSSTNGETFLQSVRLAHNLTTSGDVLTDATDSVIGGTVSISGAQLGSVVCISEIDGDAAFSTGGSVQLGGDAPVTPCGFDVFAAGVTIAGNTDAFVNGNVIRGDLACTGNAAAPTGAGNRIRGHGTDQCATLSPTPAAASAAARSAAADPAARIAGVTAKVKARTADADRQAANRAGSAALR